MSPEDDFYYIWEGKFLDKKEKFPYPSCREGVEQLNEKHVMAIKGQETLKLRHIN